MMRSLLFLLALFSAYTERSLAARAPDLEAGTTSYSDYYKLVTNSGTPLLGAAIGSMYVSYTRNRSAPVASLCSVLGSVGAAFSAFRATEVYSGYAIGSNWAPGLYRVDLPDEALASGVDKVIIGVTHPSGTTQPAMKEFSLKVNSAVVALASLHTRVSSVQTGVDNATTSLGSLHTRVSSTQTGIDTGNTSLSSMHTRISSVQTGVDAANTSLSSLHTRVASIGVQVGSAYIAVGSLQSFVNTNVGLRGIELTSAAVAAAGTLVTDIASTALARFFSRPTGAFFSDAVSGSVVYEMATGGSSLTYVAQGSLSTALLSLHVALTSLHTRVGSVQTGGDNANTSLSSPHTRVASAATGVDVANTSLGSLHTRVSSVQAGVDAGNTSLGSLHTRVSSVQAGVDAGNTSLSSLHTRVSSAQTGVDAANTSLGSLHTRVASAATQLGSAYTDLTSIHIETGLIYARIGAPAGPSMAADIGSLQVGINSGNTSLGSLHTRITSVAAQTDNLPSAVKRNTALSNFEFLMIDSADHVSPKTGLTVTAERSIDGGSFGACTNSPSEVSAGIYKIDLSASDLNGVVITLKFTSAGADARFVTVLTKP